MARWRKRDRGATRSHDPARRTTLVKRRYTPARSRQIDWAITRLEATHGWQRTWWRWVKRYLEL